MTDDRLRLIFTCCHPALALENRIALTLGCSAASVAEIAHAFLVPETTMAQRITRAKAKIKQARIPYRVPRGDDLSNRMAGVLAVLYLIFNEGYLSTTAASVREDLCIEAIRLTRQLREASASLGPDGSNAAGGARVARAHASAGRPAPGPGARRRTRHLSRPGPLRLEL